MNNFTKAKAARNRALARKEKALAQRRKLGMCENLDCMDLARKDILTGGFCFRHNYENLREWSTHLKSDLSTNTLLLMEKIDELEERLNTHGH